MDSLGEEAGDFLSVPCGDKVHSSFLSIICKSSRDFDSPLKTLKISFFTKQLEAFPDKRCGFLVEQ